LPTTLEALASRLAEHQPDTSLSVTAGRRAAVAIVLRQNAEHAIEVLMIQRAEDPRDPWSGHTAFPGGRQERGDRSLEETARRETAEEVGIRLTAAMRIGRLSDVCAGHRHGSLLSVSPFLFHHPHPEAFALSHEVARAFWLPLDHLLKKDNVCAYTPPPPTTRAVYPAFHVNGCTIWGLTYRMLCSLAQVAGEGLVVEEEFAGE